MVNISDDECENVAPSITSDGHDTSRSGDQRVLTLAEQIIAAIPERIKNVHVSDLVGDDGQEFKLDKSRYRSVVHMRVFLDGSV